MEEKVETKFSELPIEEIQPSPYQMRQVVEDEAFQELVASIGEKGVIQPIIVRMVDGKPQVVAGTRRLAASRSAGKNTIPAVIREISDEKAILWSIAENFDRVDPTLLELGRILKRLADDFYGGNPNRVAEQIGKGVGYVNDRIAILGMPEEIQWMAQDRKLNISQLNAIRRIPEPKKQIKMAGQTLRDNLSAEMITLLIQTSTEKASKTALGPPSVKEKVKNILKLILQLSNNIKQLTQANALRQAIRGCPGFQENLEALIEEVEGLKAALDDPGPLQAHIAQTILRLFVGLKWLNTAAKKERQEEREKEIIQTIKEYSFFQENLGALMQQINILTKRLEDED